MHKPLQFYLKETYKLSTQEWEWLNQSVEDRKLEDNEFFLKKGQVCKSFAYLLKGAMVQTTIDDEGEKKIIDLYTRGDWVLQHKSFTSQLASDTEIRSVGTSNFYSLSMIQMHALIGKSTSFLQMGRILESATNRLTYYDKQMSPDEKYLSLIKDRPEVLQKFPLKWIASYLNLSPETISRVRNRLAHNS